MTKLRRELISGGAVLLIVLMGAGVSKWYRTFNVKQQETNCQSRLKYLGFALRLYAQDSDGKFPDAPPNGTQINGDWLQKLWLFDYNQSDYICPSDREPFALFPIHGQSRATSYVWNDAYSAPNDGLSSPSGQMLSRIKNPGQTLLLADGADESRLKWEINDGIFLPIEGDEFKLGSIVGRHNGRPNVLFCDGHVAAKPVEQVFLPRTKNGKSFFAGLSIEDD